MGKMVFIAPGDSVTLRKPHPCGSYEWKVTRAGADIGLQCLTCGRRVLLEREEFERRVKAVQPSTGASPESASC